MTNPVNFLSSEFTCNIITIAFNDDVTGQRKVHRPVPLLVNLVVKKGLKVIDK
jgi:hypothetical protein